MEHNRTETNSHPASASFTDDNAPAEVFSRHRRRLLSIAYRMLGSAVDAEDIVQEAYIRWQQASLGEIVSPEAFLVTIVSRLCLNHLDSARVKREEYFGQWLPEPVATGQGDDPYSISQMDESLSTAFLLLLERLTPVERAVFLLREVFDYDYGEVAKMLELTQANCRQILRRARQQLKDGRPRFNASSRQREELFQQFLQASSQGEMNGLLALISKDIVLYTDGGGKARAVPNPIFGAENVIRFLQRARKKLLPQGLVSRRVEINGEPGSVTYLDGQPFSVFTVQVQDGKIRSVFIVSNPDKLARLPMLSAGRA